MTQKIVLYDTTLRDGTQAEDVNLSTPVSYTHLTLPTTTLV